MSDLIEALTILLKYGDYRRPTICSHDELVIADIDPDDVAQGDLDRLGELGFHVCTDDGGYFYSYRFGSA